MLAVGTTLAYELVGRGVIPHIRLGRALRVPRAALEAWIAANTRGAAGPGGEETIPREFTP
jgi:excisionase family DNA binding protein